MLKDTSFAPDYTQCRATIRNVVLAFLMALVVLSCGDSTPDGIIARRTMPDVLLDVHVADGILANTSPIDSARRDIHTYYDAIFHRYNIDSTVLRNSIVYYSRNPSLMKEIYTEVENRLNALSEAEQQAVAEKYRLQRVADSISTARQRDSLYRVATDSLDFKRKRHLLFNHEADSSYDQPQPVTHTALRQRMFEDIRIKGIHEGYWLAVDTTQTESTQVDTLQHEQPEPPKMPMQIDQSGKRIPQLQSERNEQQ